VGFFKRRDRLLERDNQPENIMNAPEAIAPAVSADLFITVPETILPSGLVVPAFQVSQFACTQAADGKAASTADAEPWVRINYFEAVEACEKAGFKLITETQWLAIAWNVSQQDCNWTGGKVGEGDLFQGIRNGDLDSAQPGNYEPEDSDERRWLTLSNGERICDLNGNVYQWVFDNVQGDDKGIVARDFAEDSISITTPPYPSDEKGMGNYEVWDWSGSALIRGGFWYSESLAGVFYLNYGWPGSRDDGVGFRCTK
jgi:formylglycine-generating enzyme required for sulfatase activity